MSKYTSVFLIATFLCIFAFWTFPLLTDKTHMSSRKQVLFIIGGGSHIYPTVEIAKKLIAQNAHVTYLTFDTSSRYLNTIKSCGGSILSLSEELCTINQHFTKEQEDILTNPSANFVDQPQGAQDTAILSQYFMALFWDELIGVIKKINPDVMVIDSTQAYWGKYLGKVLDIPTFVSFPSAFYYKEWKNPQFRELIKTNYAQTLPPTPKRLWAASYLRNKLGLIGSDIDENFPGAFSDPLYAIFVYTYPRFIGYNGERFLGTNLVFAGYPEQETTPLTKEQNDVVNSIVQFKNNKKLVFVSMGTDSSKSLEFFAMLGEALGNGGCNHEINKNIVVALHPGHKNAKDNTYHNAQEISLYMKQLGHSNFIVYDYFPLPHLFQKVDVFIGHGGHNSSMQALKNYVPMILLPIHGDQIIVGDKFQELGFAKTIADEINPMMICKDDFTAWHHFYDDINKRTKFIQWIQCSVHESLSEIDTTKKVADKKNKIDALLQTDQGYDYIVNLILSTTKKDCL